MFDTIFRKIFHLPGEHEQEDHGNWAHGGASAERPESYFAGWSDSDRNIVSLGDRLATLHGEPHLVDRIGETIPEREIENLLASRTTTEGAAIVKDGKLIHFFNGTEKAVKIPDSANLEGATLIHNHPTASSLSIGDLIAAQKDKLAEIRSVGNFDGAAYSFSVKPDTAWPPRGAIESTYEVNQADLLKPFADKRWRGKMTKEQLNFAVSHAIMKATAKDLGLKYRFERWT